MTDIEKVAELLKPRYKVMSGYPGSSYDIGDIVTYDSTLWRTGNYRFIEKKYCDKYPAIFRKLEWWEERQESFYIRFETKNHLVIGKFHKAVEFINIGGNCKYHLFVENCKFGLNPKYCTPSTLEEYESYNNYKDEQQ